MNFIIQRFKEVSSTSTLAKKYAAEGAPEGLVLVADYQTEGRGKPGRTWISPPGKNLLFSLLIRPDLPPHRAPYLAQLACRSVARVLEREFRIQTAFKRPNDLLVDGKKICGVLVESETTQNKIQSAVIGIGLNVNAAAEELPSETASLKQILNRPLELNSLLDCLLEELKEDLENLYAHSA